MNHLIWMVCCLERAEELKSTANRLSRHPMCRKRSICFTCASCTWKVACYIGLSIARKWQVAYLGCQTNASWCEYRRILLISVFKVVSSQTYTPRSFTTFSEGDDDCVVSSFPTTISPSHSSLSTPSPQRPRCRTRLRR